jgi:hypothetical protein
MKQYSKRLSDEQRAIFERRMRNHTMVNDIAVVVLTARELDELLTHIDQLELEIKVSTDALINSLTTRFPDSDDKE